jgi:hypothetical protein
MPYSPKIVDEMIEEARKEAKNSGDKGFRALVEAVQELAYCLGSA